MQPAASNHGIEIRLLDVKFSHNSTLSDRPAQPTPLGTILKMGNERDQLMGNLDKSAQTPNNPTRPRESIFRALANGRHRHIEMVALAITGTILGVLFAGRGRFSLGPLRTMLTLTPDISGGTVVNLGPLGKILIASHRGLVRIGVDVTSIDTTSAREIVTNPSQFEQLARIAGDDLRWALLWVTIKAVICGAFVAGLLALLAFRRFSKMLIATAISFALSISVATLAVVTYDPRAVLEPRFNGLVSAAPRLIGSAQDIAGNLGKYRIQMGRLFTNVSQLYNLGSSLSSYQVDPSTVTVLHVSDMHLNPQAWDLIRELITQFHVDIVADTGDISDHGTSLEDVYLDPIGTLGVPYVYVRGNHDSQHTQSVISKFNNAIVLDNEEIRTVAGIVFAGTGDPAFTPDKTVRQTDEADQISAGLRLASAIAGKRVDIVMVHEPTAAQPLDGSLATILAGHLHFRRVTDMPLGTRLMVQGSTGGSGMRALTSGDADPLTATILHLNRKTGKLAAWDEITMGGVGLASAQITRHLPEIYNQPTKNKIAPIWGNAGSSSKK